MASAEEIAQIFEYLSLQQDGTVIDKTRLNMLLYFAQGHALAELGHKLFPDQIDAWGDMEEDAICEALLHDDGEEAQKESKKS